MIIIYMYSGFWYPFLLVLCYFFLLWVFYLKYCIFFSISRPITW